MSNTSSSTEEVLAAIDGVLGTATALPAPDTAAPGHRVRVLAALEPVLGRAIDDALAAVDGSPVLAAALAQLVERIAHAGARAQVLAAGACAETEAHTLTDAALAAVDTALADPAAFARGATHLPADETSAADRKSLHAGPAEFLASRLHLEYFQARHRLLSHERLHEHLDETGTLVPPRYPELGRVVDGGGADPRAVAIAAAKLEGLEPSLEAQSDPGAARQELLEKVTGILRQGDAKDLGKLIKNAAEKLDASVLERQEAAMARHLGLRFRTRKAAGFLWELLVDAEGQERLCTLADDLNNPRTASGTPAAPFAPVDDGPAPERPGRGTGAGPCIAADSEPAPPIPDWAANPDTPESLRPRAGFTDVGRPLPPENPYGLPDGDKYPGESAREANARRRAQRLSQALFDALQTWMDPAGTPKEGMPMKSRIELLVMIDYAALTGALESAGFTAHGHEISAATARRMACNAGITPVVMGGRSEPLDVGRRKRFFTKGQKRAIAARDRGCANPGCSMPVHRTEVHHIKPYSEGGKTQVSNGILLCIRCHTAFHAGHFGITVVDGIPLVVLPASRDPLRRPRRNWVFHPETAAA
ncbi:hypothetical protein GCM10009715_38550 [Paeniglutamicibacter psychrophenolicus]|uniref:HNH nuclease domain-containing protein n=1 Tax=Paeniglutamicibacter psychrophenolicus TaxID=257454 RepID=A0ABS4WIB4_9MICC|nr:HNH endonuclease signature motif containing protein [Paeniglutamicibacter psychrophenolicus]MBP2375950.1 hypothetical protein [Paeniglutamicibacter psychrophenolicus]